MGDQVRPDFPKGSKWIPRLLERFPWKTHVGESYHQPGSLTQLAHRYLPGRVSRIHLYEAKERYVHLSRRVEYEALLPSEDGKDGLEKKHTLEVCQQALGEARGLLTRKQDDLNFLWREMAMVQILLVEKVIATNLLAAQLDFCREEARRLGVAKDPEVNDMIQRLAEATQESDEKQTRDRMVRALRALIERFTSIRTGRIHQQFVNIRSYRNALLILLPISILLIGNQDLLLSPANSKVPSFPSFELISGWGFLGLGLVWSVLTYLFTVAKYLLSYNILAFVFFAGLTGGFFSVVIRLRTQELVPGEDAYFTWYLLSKPFVGALGAVILFVLFNGHLVSFEVLKPLTDTLTSHTPGPEVFGFAFLSGFSERIVFPEFR